MTQFMLDTNTVSYLVRQHAAVVARVSRVPMASMCVSAITLGELLFELATLPSATRLHRAAQEFLQRIAVIPWQSETAGHYAMMRADLHRRGALFGPIDMLIAAHALSIGAILVTSDRAFSRVPELQIEDWTL